MRSAPFGPLRRRLGHAVVDGARVAVDLDPLQAGGVGILQVLDDPEPAAVVELDGDRLADHRLGGDELDREAVGRPHLLARPFPGRIPGAGRMTPPERRGTRQTRESPQHKERTDSILSLAGVRRAVPCPH